MLMSGHVDNGRFRVHKRWVMRLFRNKSQRQDTPFQRLLQQHRRQQRRRAVGTLLSSIGDWMHNFLSSTKWYGIGPIVSIITLIATIVLTIGVYNLGREQSTAHLNYYIYYD